MTARTTRPPPWAPAPAPPANTDAERRRTLGIAIAARKDAEQQLAALENDHDDARIAIGRVQSRLQNAERVLVAATNSEKIRQGGSWVDENRLCAYSVLEANTEVLAAGRELVEAEAAEIAANDRFSQARFRLHRAREAQHRALFEVIAGSTAYEEVERQHRQAWVRLRSLRKVQRLMMSACQLQYSQEFSDKAQRSESLAVDDANLAMDRDLVARWAAALEALASNADAALPVEAGATP